LCMLLVACATAPSTSGVYISDADLKWLKPGITTMGDVESKFGSPQSSMTKSDGTTVLHYIYAEQQGNQSAEFLKRLNPFAKPDIKAVQVTAYYLSFRNGKFVNYQVNQEGGTAANAATTH
ncbi:MAG TPA: hypothetical protein VKU44_09470, partial [Terriglobia bacterium]|nr:hypothetical protein [Terriglobia bacterium]